MTEHVGRLSDAIDNGDGGAVGRLTRMTKPTGKVYHKGDGDMGNGDHCPVDGHGRMYVSKSGSGNQYCPDQAHDKEKVK